MRAESFVEALSSLAGYDFLDRLEEVEVPTLIVWGRQDHVVPPADALGYASRIARRAARGLRPLRPRADGRAPGALQPGARALPRSGVAARSIVRVVPVADALAALAVAARLVDDQRPR